MKNRWWNWMAGRGTYAVSPNQAIEATPERFAPSLCRDSGALQLHRQAS